MGRKGLKVNGRRVAKAKGTPDRKGTVKKVRIKRQNLEPISVNVPSPEIMTPPPQTPQTSVSALINRFRTAPPAPRDERPPVETSSFWWMANKENTESFDETIEPKPAESAPQMASPPSCLMSETEEIEDMLSIPWISPRKSVELRLKRQMEQSVVVQEQAPESPVRVQPQNHTVRSSMEVISALEDRALDLLHQAAVMRSDPDEDNQPVDEPIDKAPVRVPEYEQILQRVRMRLKIPQGEPELPKEVPVDESEGDVLDEASQILARARERLSKGHATEEKKEEPVSTSSPPPSVSPPSPTNSAPLPSHSHFYAPRSPTPPRTRDEPADRVPTPLELDLKPSPPSASSESDSSLQSPSDTPPSPRYVEDYEEQPLPLHLPPEPESKTELKREAVSDGEVRHLVHSVVSAWLQDEGQPEPLNLGVEPAVSPTASPPVTTPVNTPPNLSPDTSPDSAVVTVSVTDNGRVAVKSSPAESDQVSLDVVDNAESDQVSLGVVTRVAVPAASDLDVVEADTPVSDQVALDAESDTDTAIDDTESLTLSMCGDDPIMLSLFGRFEALKNALNELDE